MHLDLRGRKEHEAGENFIIRRFIIFNIGMITSRVMRWGGHKLRMGEKYTQSSGTKV
jgi:hypothetical protein